MKNVEVMLEMYEIERNENKKVKLVEWDGWACSEERDMCFKMISDLMLKSKNERKRTNA